MIRHGLNGPLLCNLHQRFQITHDERISKHVGLLLRVPIRHIHHIRLQHCGYAPAIDLLLVQSRHRAVILEAMPTLQHPPTENMLLLVQNLQALYTGRRRDAGYHEHLPDAAHATISHYQVARLDELLVHLRLVKCPHYGPHHLHRRWHLLHHYRPALIRLYRMRVQNVSIVLRTRHQPTHLVLPHFKPHPATHLLLAPNHTPQICSQLLTPPSPTNKHPISPLPPHFTPPLQLLQSDPLQSNSHH
ncbi:hypothetical protein M758_10G147600 [Ceratodon purpureus]|nr:hypothetical protein M758_10G147600 [Ceratodon purpureus]